MSQALWSTVEDYCDGLLIGADPVLAAARAAATAAGLPEIAVSPSQGKFLHLLARIAGARRVLEIGALGGYSTIWMARALPADGSLISLEANPKHLDVARANIARAGFANQVEFRLGAALDTLPRLEAEAAGPFDFIFIDADKPNIPNYVAWALRLARVGAVIVVDNVIRDGRVADGSSADPDVQGVRRLNALLASEKRLSATTLQTVGSKGYDGFTLALVVA